MAHRGIVIAFSPPSLCATWEKGFLPTGAERAALAWGVLEMRTAAPGVIIRPLYVNNARRKTIGGTPLIMNFITCGLFIQSARECRRLFSQLSDAEASGAFEESAHRGNYRRSGSLVERDKIPRRGIYVKRVGRDNRSRLPCFAEPN